MQRKEPPEERSGNPALSKSAFLRGIQCPRSLYLYVHHPELRDPIDESREAVFASGREVGLAARGRFPGGVLASAPPLHAGQAALLAGPDADEWQGDEIAARHAGQDQAREAREERLAWQERQAEEVAARAEAARLAAAAAAAESLRETAERRDAPPAQLVEVPGFFSSPVGWLEATLINAGRRDAETRDRLTRTLAPLVDPLRAVADHDRNPVTASFHDAAWARIHAVEERRRDYVNTANEAGVALSENRWGDALRGIGHLGEVHLQGARDGVATQLGMVWGLVTTPVRLVTRTVPAFVTAVSERMQGRDRGWDVVFTGTMVEADLLGTYYIAQPTGLIERANLALERRVFGSLEAGAPNELLPAGVTGQWRDWTLPQGINQADQALSWQSLSRFGLYGPNRELPMPPGRMLSPEDGGLLTLPEGDVNLLPIGEPTNPTAGFPGDPRTRLLWTADERGVNFAVESQTWDSGRGIPTHTNLSEQGYAAGEAWRTGPDQLTMTSASRAFGFNDGLGVDLFAEAGMRYESAVDFIRSLGIDVNSLPFGWR